MTTPTRLPSMVRMPTLSLSVGAALPPLQPRQVGGGGMVDQLPQPQQQQQAQYRSTPTYAPRAPTPPVRQMSSGYGHQQPVSAYQQQSVPQPQQYVSSGSSSGLSQSSSRSISSRPGSAAAAPMGHAPVRTHSAVNAGSATYKRTATTPPPRSSLPMSWTGDQVTHRSASVGPRSATPTMHSPQQQWQSQQQTTSEGTYTLKVACPPSQNSGGTFVDDRSRTSTPNPLVQQSAYLPQMPQRSNSVQQPRYHHQQQQVLSEMDTDDLPFHQSQSAYHPSSRGYAGDGTFPLSQGAMRPRSNEKRSRQDQIPDGQMPFEQMPKVARTTGGSRVSSRGPPISPLVHEQKMDEQSQSSSVIIEEIEFVQNETIQSEFVSTASLELELIADDESMQAESLDPNLVDVNRCRWVMPLDDTPALDVSTPMQDSSVLPPIETAAEDTIVQFEVKPSETDDSLVASIVLASPEHEQVVPDATGPDWVLVDSVSQQPAPIDIAEPKSAGGFEIEEGCLTQSDRQAEGKEDHDTPMTDVDQETPQLFLMPPSAVTVPEPQPRASPAASPKQASPKPTQPAAQPVVAPVIVRKTSVVVESVAPPHVSSPHVAPKVHPPLPMMQVEEHQVDFMEETPEEEQKGQEEQPQQREAEEDYRTPSEIMFSAPPRVPSGFAPASSLLTPRTPIAPAAGPAMPFAAPARAGQMSIGAKIEQLLRDDGYLQTSSTFEANNLSASSDTTLQLQLREAQRLNKNRDVENMQLQREKAVLDQKMRAMQCDFRRQLEAKERFSQQQELRIHQQGKEIEVLTKKREADIDAFTDLVNIAQTRLGTQ